MTVPTLRCTCRVTPRANVVCVGASDNRDLPADFSNFSPTAVDLYAPGAWIRSATIGGIYTTRTGPRWRRRTWRAWRRCSRGRTGDDDRRSPDCAAVVGRRARLARGTLGDERAANAAAALAALPRARPRRPTPTPTATATPTPSPVPPPVAHPGRSAGPPRRRRVTVTRRSTPRRRPVQALKLVGVRLTFSVAAGTQVKFAVRAHGRTVAALVDDDQDVHHQPHHRPSDGRTQAAPRPLHAHAGDVRRHARSVSIRVR